MDAAHFQLDEELSAFDYMMFRADMDPRSRSTMIFIETLDRTPDVDRLRQQIERATRAVPRLRQRVVAPLLPLAPARWVVDPDFTLDYHFRRIALPAPGSFRQLLDLAEVLLETPLDRSRPLWEVTLVEGLDDRGAEAALFWKLSHTVTDGVGGVLLDQYIHQSSPDSDLAPMPTMPTPEDVTALDLTKRAVRRLPFTVVRRGAGLLGGATRLASRTARNPVRSVAAATRTVTDLRSMAGPPPVEPSPLLRRRSLNRRFEALDVSLADLRRAAKTRDCSVNDAYLAAVAGAMSRYHEGMGLPIDAIGIAMPVSVRDSSKHAAGNQWSAVTLRLPLDEPDPGKRMRAIREQVLTARTNSSIDPSRVVAPLVAWLPQQLMAGNGTGGLGFDIQVSNVPGLPGERYIAGVRIARSVPIGPLPGVAMMVTMVSSGGRCFVGVNYDRASIVDDDLLSSSLRGGFEEVLAVGRPSSTGTSARRTPRNSQERAERRTSLTGGAR